MQPLRGRFLRFFFPRCLTNFREDGMLTVVIQLTEVE